MNQHDYFPAIGELLSKRYGISASVLGAGGYSYKERVDNQTLPELLDIDFIIVVDSQTDLLNLLSSQQKILNDLFKIVIPEYTFLIKDIKLWEERKINFVRYAGKNSENKKISIKITTKDVLNDAYSVNRQNDFLILSHKDKRFFPRKSVFGNEVFVGLINGIAGANFLSVWGDKDFYLLKDQCIPGMITDMLITGKIIFDHPSVNLQSLRQKAVYKLVKLVQKYRKGYPDDWSEVFVRGKKFPEDYKTKLNHYICSVIKRKMTFVAKSKGMDNYPVKFYLNIVPTKDRLIYHPQKIKKNFKRRDIKNFIQLPKHAISFNSDFGKMVLDDNREFFYKKPKSAISFNSELNGVSMLSCYYRKLQYPVYWNKGNNLVAYPWSDYQPLSTKFINKLIDNNEALMDLELKRDGDILNAYISSLEENRRVKAQESSGINNLYFQRLVGGRLNDFYDNSCVMVGDRKLHVSEICSLNPIINSRKYGPLGESIETAIKLLNPDYLKNKAKICGLGDGHIGNLMVNDDLSDYFYIDYEFSGYHSPYLDMAKPLYLDCFWRIWLADYIKNFKPEITAKVVGRELIIEHQYQISEVEKMMLKAKMGAIVKNFNKHLKEKGLLCKDWEQILNSAVFCCAFLTRNISKFDSNIFLLNLTFAIIAGSFVDFYLREIE